VRASHAKSSKPWQNTGLTTEVADKSVELKIIKLSGARTTNP